MLENISVLLNVFIFWKEDKYDKRNKDKIIRNNVKKYV